MSPGDEKEVAHYLYRSYGTFRVRAYLEAKVSALSFGFGNTDLFRPCPREIYSVWINNVERWKYR